MENFNNLVTGIPEPEDMVNDGWTDIIGKLLVRVQQDESPDLSPEGLANTMEIADFEKMEQIRSRVDAIVQDPATAEALKPYYRQFCKRPCFHDDYLETYNRPTVQLIDTEGRGVERITEKGVVANGVEYEVDCIIYATGFEVGTDYTRRAGYDVVGRGGVSLKQRWADGIKTLHGMHTRGFPNLFIIQNAQSGFTANFPHMLDEQSKHLSYIVQEARKADVRTVEVSEQAEAEWVETILKLAMNNRQFLESCTPGYYNNEGKPGDRSLQNGFYGGGAVGFIKLIQEWRDKGDLEGLELTK
jgi:cyclohexanone monooxygenase